MERLTKRINDVVTYIGTENEYDTGMIAAETASSVAAVREILLRLAAYEDTRLTPEEIKAPFTEDTMINLAAQALGVEPSRLRELAEADKDGRLVVPPCNVGDTVWRIVRDGEPHITRDEVCNMSFADDMTLCVELVGGRVTFTEKFGKTVFLTHEEAERAMEGRKDG